MTSLSLRARLTVWYSLVLLAVLAMFGATVVWQQGRIGVRRVDRELDDVTTTLANVLRDELTEMPTALAAAVETERTMATPGRATAVFDERGHVLGASWDRFSLAGGPPRAAEGSRAWTAQSSGGAWRVHAQPRAVGERTYMLLVAAPLVDVLREQHETQEAMWVGIPIVLLLAAGGGLWLASIGLRPITTMARRAVDLPLTGAEDLGTSDRDDELGQLARAFNGLVARLRQALQTQRQFMADASHELRTPVSVIQSAADVMLSRGRREESEYRDALAIVGAQSRRLGRLVEAMLVLARADAGGYPLRPVNLYLNELAVECQRTVTVLARERDVTVHVSAAVDVAFRGDEDLLRRMLLNLVQNAVQHTSAGGAVRVDIAAEAGSVAIRVRDEGHGIPAADRARIFDRFVQLDAARRADGAGLGLPIARWVAEVHGGTLDLEDSAMSGSTFLVVLPLVEPARIERQRAS